jgi:hypothetical protein
MSALTLTGLGGFLLLVLVVVVVAVILLSRTRVSAPSAAPGQSVSESAFWADFANLRQRLRKRRPCSYPKCPNQEGWLCAYAATSERCKVVLCDDHVVMIDNLPFCTRHAAVLHQQREKEARAKRLLENPAASRDDLVVELLKEVCRRLEKDIVAVLNAAAAGRGELKVSWDQTVGESWDGPKRLGWQKSWGLHNASAYLIRVIVRIGTDEPPTATMLINQRVVFERVPDWIAVQVVGRQPTQQDYDRFVEDAINALRAGIIGQMAPLA